MFPPARQKTDKPGSQTLPTPEGTYTKHGPGPCSPFAFVTRRHIDIRTRSSKQPTNPPKCCTVTMVNRDYCSVKNCRFNSFSNKRTERVSFHKIPTQSHLKTVWKRFIRRGKPRNHTVGEIHSVNLVFIRGYPFSLCSLCSCFPGFVGV